jgi:hypothetical protein
MPTTVPKPLPPGSRPWLTALYPPGVKPVWPWPRVDTKEAAAMVLASYSLTHAERLAISLALVHCPDDADAILMAVHAAQPGRIK